jgi:hypothetical protein
MIHHTKDIGERAAHIAEQEAKKYYQQTGGNFFEKWLEVYKQVLLELASI